MKNGTPDGDNSGMPRFVKQMVFHIPAVVKASPEIRAGSFRPSAGAGAADARPGGGKRRYLPGYRSRMAIRFTVTPAAVTQRSTASQP